MFKQKELVAAILAGSISLFYPQISAAQQLRGAEILNWPSDSQGFYFRTSVAMAGLIAARNNKKQAGCVDRWYFSDRAKSDAAIVKAMRKNSDFHPQAIILAMLQKACGSFRY